MSWIEEIEVADAGEELAAIYADLIERRGKIANIMKVHSLNPGSMTSHLDLYMELMFGKSPLSRAEREAIAVTVSATNRCEYCVNHHYEALARYEKDENALDLIRNGGELDSLGARRAAILGFAANLTADPSMMRRSDVAQLRDAGLTDREILDVALITAYFNFVNRIALSLGVAYSDDEMSGYKI